jgi:hypothetical protein
LSLIVSIMLITILSACGPSPEEIAQATASVEAEYEQATATEDTIATATQAQAATLELTQPGQLPALAAPLTLHEGPVQVYYFESSEVVVTLPPDLEAGRYTVTLRLAEGGMQLGELTIEE